MTSELPTLPLRPADGHKGTFGTVCVLGGRADDQRVMAGGPAFAATAALRGGCGLAVLAVPTPIMAAALVIAPGATGLALPVDEAGALKPSDAAQLIDRHLASFQCLAIGPGMGTSVSAQQVVVRLLGQDVAPMVIDADALNCMAAVREIHMDFHCHAVLTPHPGEYKRLADALNIHADPTDEAARPGAAQQLAQRLGCIVALKGRHTIISDGLETHVNRTGNVALATAGTGDVLTGLVAGLIAQFYKPNLGSGSRQISARQQGGMSLMDCTRLGVNIHGLAADRWAQRHGQAGMLATDLLCEIPHVLNALRCGSNA
jgi:ADP-dependent NAD(P)H-hydrate dehydratase